MSICSKCGCPGNIGSTNPEMEITRLTNELAEAKATIFEQAEGHDEYKEALDLSQKECDSLRAKLEAVEQRANDSYKQGVEDAHRCEKRHATIDKLEAENAALREENKDRSWQITKLREEVENLKVGPSNPTYRKLKADLDASQNLVEELNAKLVIKMTDHNNCDKDIVSLQDQRLELNKKLADSEASRGRLIEALESNVGIVKSLGPGNGGWTSRITLGEKTFALSLAEDALSEPSSSVYDAMKGAREALAWYADDKNWDQHTGAARELVRQPNTVDGPGETIEEADMGYRAEKALSSLTAVLGMSEGRD